jgi:hypothetical protein
MSQSTPAAPREVLGSDFSNAWNVTYKGMRYTVHGKTTSDARAELRKKLGVKVLQPGVKISRA